MLPTTNRLLSETSRVVLETQAAPSIPLPFPWVRIFQVLLLAYEAMRQLGRTAVRMNWGVWASFP